MMIVSNDSRHLLEGINGIFPQEIMKDEPKYRYFYLLGACETLVYEKISQNAPVYYGDTLGSEICPECGIKSTKQGFREATSTINAKKEYQKSPTEYKLKTEQKAKKKYKTMQRLNEKKKKKHVKMKKND